MGQTLVALLKLQSIETQLAQVRGRLRSRQSAVAVHQRKIDELRLQHSDLHELLLTKRKQADVFDLELKEKEAAVAKLRTSLNTARTNKEYAALLTQINTLRADNSKLEEVALRLMQDADVVKVEQDELADAVQAAEEHLEEVQQTSAEEVTRLTGMVDDLLAQRTEAEGDVPPDILATFSRVAHKYDGEAMAVIESHGKKPPHNYTCGGCFMGLNAEHVNALQVADKIRTCDNCGRILYLDPERQEAHA